MSSEESCDPEFYLKKHHVMAYIEDAVTFLLERKQGDSKTKPYELLTDYFESITKGTHILFRDYAFISLTPRNRSSFIRLFWHTFFEIAERGESMRVMEYLSLVRLLCHDFPSGIIQNVARVVFSYGALENLVCFSNFLYTFQVLFYYELFLKRCELVYMDLISGQTPLELLEGGSTMVVSMPSTGGGSGSRPETASSMHSVSSAEGEDVVSRSASTVLKADKLLDVELFLKAVTHVCTKIEKEPGESCPSVQVLTEIITELPSVTFYDFVLALSKSEKINGEIGVLPERDRLRTAGKVHVTVFPGPTKSDNTAL